MTPHAFIVRNIRFVVLIGLGFLGITSAAAQQSSGENNRPWRVAVYAGRHTDTRFHEIVRFRTDFKHSGVAAVAVSRTFAEHGTSAEWEGEIQAAKHGGRQHHAELNAAVLLRWTRFPWSHAASTTVALGIGPSWASSTPRIERDRGKDTARRLLFMPFEITAGPPDRRWEGFVRVHHRSGGFDVISRGTGSNFVAGGLRIGW